MQICVVQIRFHPEEPLICKILPCKDTVQFILGSTRRRGLITLSPCTVFTIKFLSPNSCPSKCQLQGLGASKANWKSDSPCTPGLNWNAAHWFAHWFVECSLVWLYFRNKGGFQLEVCFSHTHLCVCLD